MREKTWVHLKGKEDAEPWKKLGIGDRDSKESQALYESLATPSTKYPLYDVPFDIPKEKYLSVLNPPQPVEDYGEEQSSSTGQRQPKPLSEIRKLPLQEQVAEFMRNAQIIQFTELKSVLLPNCKPEDEKALLNSISKMAVLIRGVWVIKTAFCTMKTDRLGAVRNYLLMTFALDMEYILPHQIGQNISVDPAHIIDILRPFCVMEPGKGWRLRKLPDEAFIQQIPSSSKDYVKLYYGSWLKNRPTIIEDLNKNKDQIEMKEEEKNPHIKTSRPARAGLSVAFNETRKPEEKELLEFVFNLLEKYGLMSLQMIMQKIAEEDKAGTFKDLPKGQATTEVVQRILSKCTRTLHGDYYLSTTGDLETDKYRELVIGIFTKQKTCTKKEIDDACMSAFHIRMPAKVYQKVMRQLAYFKNSKWTWKSDGGFQEEKK